MNHTGTIIGPCWTKWLWLLCGLCDRGSLFQSALFRLSQALRVSIMSVSALSHVSTVKKCTVWAVMSYHNVWAQYVQSVDWAASVLFPHRLVMWCKQLGYRHSTVMSMCDPVQGEQENSKRKGQAVKFMLVLLQTQEELCQIRSTLGQSARHRPLHMLTQFSPWPWHCTALHSPS